VVSRSLYLVFARFVPPARLATSRSDLTFSVVDSVAFSVMVGIGETYLAAFVLALGLADVAAGLIATAPMLAGGILQLASPWAVRRLASHRLWVVLCSYTQAAALLLLMGAAVVGPSVGAWVFLPASLYWAAGLAAGPAWNTWIEELVPRPIRARFMARRSRLSQFGLLFGFVAGALLLQHASRPSQPALIFAVLFGVAAAGRFVSAVFLSWHSEPAPREDSTRAAGLRRTLSTIHRHHGSRLVVYLLAVQTAVYLSAPYFTPYMLRKLEMSYVHYMVLIASAFLGRVIALPWLGRFAQRYGAHRLLWLGGVGITPMAAGWLVSDAFWFLMLLQFTCGIVWGAYELAMCLSFF
jgi:MFS family permease